MQMTFWSPQNHPTSFTADVLLVSQLLAHDIVLHMSTQGTDVIGASLFPGEYISCPTSFHRSLFLAITQHHTPTPRQEGRLHFSLWVCSQARTCYSPVHSWGIYICLLMMEVITLTQHWGIEIRNHWHIQSPHTITCLQEGARLIHQEMRLQQILQATGIL